MSHRKNYLDFFEAMGKSHIYKKYFSGNELLSINVSPVLHTKLFSYSNLSSDMSMRDDLLKEGLSLLSNVSVIFSVIFEIINNHINEEDLKEYVFTENIGRSLGIYFINVRQFAKLFNIEPLYLIASEVDSFIFKDVLDDEVYRIYEIQSFTTFIEISFFIEFYMESLCSFSSLNFKEEYLRITGRQIHYNHHQQTLSYPYPLRLAWNGKFDLILSELNRAKTSA